MVITQLEQYTTTLSATITRMTMAGVTLGQLGFDCLSMPGSSANRICDYPLTDWSDIPASDWKYEMFHPAGGSVSPQSAKSLGILLEDGTGCYSWVGGVQIAGVGTTTLGSGRGMDLVLTYYCASKALCEAVNEKNGISSISSTNIASLTSETISASLGDSDNNPIPIAGDASSPFYGKFMGCTQNNSYYSIYNVILAR